LERLLFYLIVESPHKLDVKRLQAVARGRDKVQTAVDTGVLDLAWALHPTLPVEEELKLALDKFDYWIPAFVVVHFVPKAGSVYNTQVELNAAFFDSNPSLLDLQSG
jgi:hypothetical protein